MYRIDGTDANAIGRKSLVLSFEPPSDGAIDEAQVWAALESVYDPEIPINLVSLGLIYAVNIDQVEQRVNIDMTLTAPACGMGPVLVGDVEYRVKMVPNVQSVQVNLVFDPPWSRDMMSEEAQLEAGVFF
jgi:probable FeS assembly SUF system protein SufT